MRLQNLLIRAGIFFGIFLVLHFLHDAFPNRVTGVVAGTSESVFQHMKMGFYAYLIAGTLEYRLIPTRQWLFSGRILFPWLFTSVAVPWMLFLLYYIMPAVVSDEVSMGFHVTYSIIITYIAGIFAAIMRDNLAESPLRFPFRLMTALLFAATLLIMVVFNIETPHLDLFELP